MSDFETLGAFYLGRRHDVDDDETTSETILVDAQDLTTHALCVGMTGSGKTGLCVSLLEEAAIDGVPALVIDPKGDLANLLLGFPKLAAKDFEPWVDPAEAAREGSTPAAYAQRVAKRWREGLASWGQDGARIRRMQEAADFRVYTPGSDTGTPLSILRSFDAPPPAVRDDFEALQDRVQSAVAGLLGLLGRSADPVLSREGVLLANLFDHAWRAGRGLELAELVQAIQKPPFEKLGVIDLETFYPANDRMQLALALNGVLASPSFAQWTQGEPLDIDRLLRTEAGRPRIAILSIAHLSESERMFFVTTLLNEVVSWMRGQSGTSSLRALLYMDEIFGYFPPSAEPPSKRPMLTLLKQARAYGLGVVLATQNPVDLDYKGLGNTGLWFLGRLQTERDKARVLDGLEGAMATSGRTFDRARLDAVLSGLQKRVFLMNNVHDDGPVTFKTRWAMSYLRGPLSRAELRRLRPETNKAPRKRKTAAALTASPPPAPATPAAPPDSKPSRPSVPAAVREWFFAPSAGLSTPSLLYRPGLVSGARLHYANARAKVDHWVELLVRAPLEGAEDFDLWEQSEVVVDPPQPSLTDGPIEGASFAALPDAASRAKSYTKWQRSLKSYLYRSRALTLWRSREFKCVSTPGESEPAFRARVAQLAREDRDIDLAKLKKRYAPKLARVQERMRKAEAKIEREEEQVQEKKGSSLLSLGTTLLGALLGRKVASATNVRRAGSTARSYQKIAKEKADVERAQADLEAEAEKLAVLEAEFQAATQQLQTDIRADAFELEELVLRPRKADIEVAKPVLCWTPTQVAEIPPSQTTGASS